MNYRLASVVAALVCIAPWSAAQAQPAPPAPLAAFAKAWAAISGYHTTAHAYQVKGSDTQNSIYDYTFDKPSTISMGIVSGPNAGNSVSWSGGTTVRAGKGMFTKTVALTDPLVTSLRGLTIVQLSFGDILSHAEQTAGNLTASTTTLDGTTVDVVNLDVANPSADGGLTREAIYLSPQTNLPLRVDGFQGAELVQTVGFSGTTTH